MSKIAERAIRIPFFIFVSLLILGCQMKYVVNFDSDRDTVNAGEPVTLRWNILHQENVTLLSAEIDSDIGPVEQTGSQVVHPTDNVRYRLLAKFVDEKGIATEEERFVDIVVNKATDTAQNFCFCDDDIGVNRTVINPNSTQRSIGHKSLEALRVTMPGKETASLSSIQSATRRFVETQEKISRGRLDYDFRASRTVDTDTTTCSVAKDAAERARTKGTFVTIITVPCGPQHASIAQSKVHIQQNIQFIRHHEVGHVLGLNHAGTWESATNTVESYGDYSSNMSRGGAPSYTASQLHGLGWTDPHESVRINDYLQRAGYFEGKIRPVDRNQPGVLPLAFVYEVPYNDRRIWVSAPYNDRGKIYVHSQRTCKGCSGMYMGTRRLGIIDDVGVEQRVGGLAITLLDSTMSGKEYTEFSVRIRPDETPYIVHWPFDDVEGTAMTKLKSVGVITPGPWTHSPKGAVRSTGEGTLRYKPSDTSVKQTSTWFSLGSSANEINKGKAWMGIDISGFRFAGQAGERLRLGLADNVKSDALIAELQLVRTASNAIQLLGYNGKTEVPANAAPIHSSDVLQGQLEIVVELDFDALTYQIFYRNGNHAAWTPIDAPTAMSTSAREKNLQTTLRLASSGSFMDAYDEGVNIDRLYVSHKNPMTESLDKTASYLMPAHNHDTTAQPTHDIDAHGEQEDHLCNEATSTPSDSGAALTQE